MGAAQLGLRHLAAAVMAAKDGLSVVARVQRSPQAAIASRTSASSHPFSVSRYS